MKKMLSLLIAAFLITTPVHAETIYEDTTTTVITEGVTHQVVDTFTENGWRRADVIRIDLTDENLELKVMTAPDGTAHLATVKSMAEHYGTKAAVNADFFNIQSGETNMLGMVYQDGELISTPSKDNFVSFAITEDNKVVFDYFTFTGTLYAENTSLVDYTTSCELYQINKVPVTTGGITMITPAWGETVAVPQYCYAMICEGYDTDQYKMTGLSWGGESVPIPQGGAVFIANYSVNPFLNFNFALGDVIRVETSITPDIDSILEASGGNTLIVDNGEVCKFTSNITGKAQRTAMGLSPSGKTLVLVTIDGRETDCKGFDQTDLAEFMIALGCEKAINLDGGGSTTMVTEDRFTSSQSVNNSVSSLRKVSTAVGVISHHEPGEVSGGEIRLSDETVIAGDSFDVATVFYDEFYNNVAVDMSEVSITCSDKDATVNGTTITPHTGGVHTVKAVFDDVVLQTDIRVLDDIFAINIYPESIKSDKDRTFTVTAYDRTGYAAPVPASMLTFSSTDGITMSGATVKKGSLQGTVTAHFGSLTSVAVVDSELYQREDDKKEKDTFEGFIENGEKITVTGAIETPSNLLGRFVAKERLADLITRGDVYALSEDIFDMWNMFTVYRKTNGFTERVIENTKIVTIYNETTSSIRLTDSSAWGKIKNVCENITQENLVLMITKPVYGMNEGERLVWDYYMDMLTDKGVNVFVITNGTKSEVTVDNGVRYIYLGALSDSSIASMDYALESSRPLTLTFSGDEIRYTFE